jgi:hypothetical protein
MALVSQSPTDILSASDLPLSFQKPFASALKYELKAKQHESEMHRSLHSA